MIRTDLGIATAYAEAVSKGYTGTRDEFGQMFADFGKTAEKVTEDKKAVEQMKLSVEETKNSVDTTAAEFGQNVADKTAEATAAITEHANTEKGSATAAISEAKDAATGAITEAQTSATDAIASAKDSATAEIAKKGTDTLATIPEDYTALTGQVGSLKEDLHDKANSPKDKKEIELDNLTTGGLIKVDGTILTFNGYEYGYTNAQLGDEFYVTGTSWKNTLPVFVEFDANNNVVRSFTGDDSVPAEEMSTYKEQYFRVQNEKTTRVGFNGAENGEFKLAVKKNMRLSLEEYVNQKTSKLYADVDKLSIIKYGDCVKKPYAFNAKRCDVFGDSIARGWVHWDTTKYPITENNWVKLFCDKVGMTFTNHAIGGSSSSGVLAQIRDAGQLTSDYIFVAFGVNDWQDAIALNDFRNNVNAICNALKENFTGIDVIFITPINHAEIIPHKEPIADLQEYRNIITEVALSSEYSVVQGNTFPFPDKNGEYASLVFGDRIHPTEKIGYPIYANSLSAKLN